MDEDRIEGSAGDDRGIARGMVDETFGAVQDGYGRARARVREMLDNAPAAARDAVASGRDYYRRGAAVVTRSAADNTALTMLAAGIAMAAVSWLVFGRRRGGDGKDEG